MERKLAILLGGAAALFAFAAPARAQGTLTVYCTVQEEWCRPMVAAFEKTTGIKVLMTRKSSGEFYAQIKAEAANPRGDIWWGGTGDPHLQAAEEGLTEPYKSPKLSDLQDWAEERIEQAFEWRLAHRGDLVAFLASHEESMRALDDVGAQVATGPAESGRIEDLSLKAIGDESS